MTPQTIQTPNHQQSTAQTFKRFSISFISNKQTTVEAEMIATDRGSTGNGKTSTTNIGTNMGRSKKPQLNKFQVFVNMIKDGPAGSIDTHGEDEYEGGEYDYDIVDPLVDAPMPRRKTSYERYLKHQVRLSQMKRYDELVEKDELQYRLKSNDSSPKSRSTKTLLKLRRNNNNRGTADHHESTKLSEDSSLGSCKSVRFSLDDDLNDIK